MHFRLQGRAVVAFAAFGLLLVPVSAGAATAKTPVFLVKKGQAAEIYLRYSGSAILHHIPDAETAISFVGKNWAARIRIVSTATFRQYRIGTSLASVVKKPIVQPAPAPSPMPAPMPAPAPVPTPTPSQPISGTVPTLAGCSIFPADNAWNKDVSRLAIHANSAAYIASISASKGLHPDFGADQSYGIPITVVPASQAKVPITFTAYGDESDPGPYPIPTNANVESGSDSHVLVLQSGTCTLYELYNAHKNTSGGWNADSGAVFALASNALRPQGWTSTDAAGLPILPGLVRYDEVATGVINHAIRFTAPKTQNGWILPATHHAGSANASLPPMGLRVRLKADYDTSKLTGQALVIATAMKKYGLILADNGSSWYFQGATDPRWNDDQLNQLKAIPGNAFEAVETGPIVKE